MTDEEAIPQALTPEEWAQMLADPYWYAYHKDSHAPAWPRLTSRHALAAAYLYGQPFGFTQEESDLISFIAEEYRLLAPIAAKIKALLPPPSAPS